MNRIKGLTVLVLFGIAAAMVIGAIAYSSAEAANLIVPTISNHIVWHNERGFEGGISDGDLAAALGIGVEELDAAYEEAYAAALDQAVADGLITQDQADELLDSGRAFPFGRRWSGWLSQNGIDFDTHLAEALGISVEELEEAYITAHMTQIDEAVAEGRLTEEQADLLKGRYALSNSENFRTAMQSAFEEAVNAAVAEGVITQSQADQILENSSGLGLRQFRGLEGFRDLGGRHFHRFGERTPFEIPDESIEPAEPEGDGI